MDQQFPRAGFKYCYSSLRVYSCSLVLILLILTPPAFIVAWYHVKIAVVLGGIGILRFPNLSFPLFFFVGERGDRSIISMWKLHFKIFFPFYYSDKIKTNRSALSWKKVTTERDWNCINMHGSDSFQNTGLYLIHQALFSNLLTG